MGHAIGPVQASTRLGYEGGKQPLVFLHSSLGKSNMCLRQIKHASAANQTCDALSRKHGLPLAMSSLIHVYLILAHGGSIRDRATQAGCPRDAPAACEQPAPPLPTQSWQPVGNFTTAVRAAGSIVLLPTAVTASPGCCTTVLLLPRDDVCIPIL